MKIYIVDNQKDNIKHSNEDCDAYILKYKGLHEAHSS